MSCDASGRETTGGRQAPLPWATIATRHRCAPSRAPKGPRITCCAEHGMARNGGRAVLENVPHTLRGCMGTFSRGAPSGSAYRRSAQRQRSRPSRRPEVATTARVRRPTLATAGRRAGAEARRAPNATEGRCIEEPAPKPPQTPNLPRPCQLIAPTDTSSPTATTQRPHGQVSSAQEPSTSQVSYSRMDSYVPRF
jgi:hypothetical protein